MSASEPTNSSFQWAKVAPGDQTTTYAYGSNTTSSGVARNDLLASVAYPDSVSGSDVVGYTYNTLGQTVTVTDQRGTGRTFLYDDLGRLTDDCVTTVGSDTDDAVLRISTAYEVRGMPATVTSYDNAAPGSGTALNQCAMTYNSFAQLTKEQQDHNGAVSGSSPSVQYGYDSGASSSNEVRLNGLTYPNSRVITYSYGTSGGVNDLLNRVDTIQDTTSGTTDLASYTYLGLGTVVRIQYPEPSVWLDLWGGTSGTFNGLDLFNRVIDQRWQSDITGTPADIDRYQYGYDQNSNRLYKANVVGTPIVSGGLDEFYTYDHLNRLVEMQRGTLNGTKTGITGTPSREMDWTLDPTGNWPGYLTKTSGTTDLNQTRTSNKVNEITALSESTGPTWVTPAYDAAGNTTTMPQVATPTSSYTAVYDAWNRMVEMSAGSTTVATYVYDGRNRRIVKVTTSPSETRHFYFTDSWQDVEERPGTSASMDKQYVWGMRYVDELVCRDDATPERLYACQDGNFNLTAITNTSGTVEERYLFDPYGNRTIMTSSWGTTSSSGYDWVIAHQGLMLDAESELNQNRNRELHPVQGVFVERDAAVYSGGPNLYEYSLGNPIALTDSHGLLAAPCSQARFRELRDQFIANKNPNLADPIGNALLLAENAFQRECERNNGGAPTGAGGTCCTTFSSDWEVRGYATLGACVKANQPTYSTGIAGIAISGGSSLIGGTLAALRIAGAATVAGLPSTYLAIWEGGNLLGVLAACNAQVCTKWGSWRISPTNCWVCQ
jgi:RHS repeat-associated protein